ncbi:Ltp family lipoprotein [Bifidobacterium primatium]|nr:Ltp family lipoprotein [Bifidobacterium primatium]
MSRPIAAQGNNASIIFDGREFTILRGSAVSKVSIGTVQNAEIIPSRPDHDGALIIKVAGQKIPTNIEEAVSDPHCILFRHEQSGDIQRFVNEVEPSIIPAKQTSNANASLSNAKKYIVPIVIITVMVFGILSIVYGAVSGGDDTESASSSQESSPLYSETPTVTDTPTHERTATGITATYLGPLINGTEINSQNTGIEVKVQYDDGTDETVSGWTVVNPGKVTYQKETTFTIDYQGQRTQLKLTGEPPYEYQNALTQAQQYSDNMYMSKAGIYQQLTSEYGGKFDNDAAQYAIDHVKADWNKNALKTAENYQKQMSLSREEIRSQLTSPYGEQFTQSEADYAVAHLPQ